MNTFAGFHLVHSASLVWLADAVAKGTIALLIVALVNLLFRKRSAAAQYWLWLVGLAGLVVVPLLAAVLPGWRALPSHAAMPAQVVTARAAEEVSTGSGSRERRTFAEPRAASRAKAINLPSTTDMAAVSPITSSTPAATSPTPVAEVHAARRAPIPWIGWLLSAWVIGFILSLLPLVLGMLSLWWLERRCDALLSDHWQRLLKSAATKIGLHKDVALIQSTHRAMPMTWGIYRPKLLVPMEAADWPAAQQKTVLMHELAHVKRADCLTDLLARLICASYWFHPLAWFALLRMRDLRERACDDMVLAAGSDASQYAEHLLQVATIALPNRFAACAIAMARRSNFRGRVEAILDDGRNRRPLGRFGACMILFAALCVSAPLAMLRAGEAPQAKSSPPTTQPAADIEGDVLDSDGKPVVGADVQMISRRFEKGASEFLGVDVVSQTRTDEAGIFHLPTPPMELRKSYLIRATTSGYAYGDAALSRSNGRTSFLDGARHEMTDRPSIVVPPEARLSGVVVDSTGNPVAGAKIYYGQIDNPAITEATGGFAFAKIRPSRFGVFSDLSRLYVRHPDYLPGDMRVEDIVAGKEKTVRVTLEKGLLLRGRMSDAETDQPLKGFRVVIETEVRDERHFYGASDESGHYELRVPGPRVVVHPFPPSANDDQTNYYSIVDVRTISPKTGDAPLEADFQFRRGRKITGRIIGDGQIDLASCWVQAAPPGGDTSYRGNGRHMVPVDAEGMFHLTQLKPGTYDLTVTAPRGGRSQTLALKRAVTVDAARDLTDVSIDLRGGPDGIATSASLVDFKGVVHYPDGKPAINAQVMLTPEIEPDPYRRTDNGDVGGRKYTSKDGTFEFDGIKPTAQWTIWVLDSSKEMGASQVLSTPEQLKAPIQLTLQTGAEFSGTVVDQNGKPMPGFEVSLSDVRPSNIGESHRPRVRAIADEQGRYRLTGFVPPAGVKGFVLEAHPPYSESGWRGPTSVANYSKFDIVPGTKVGGYDFEVTKTDSHMTIKPKGPPATQDSTSSHPISQPVPGSENRGDSVPRFSE